MIDAGLLMTELTGRGVSQVSGVPCSFLTPIINRAISDPNVGYLPVTQEGEAVALAAGAWLGGGLGCVISQNSGLGNIVNPLTSLLHPCRIPALLMITWRGRPGRPDEPQHELMGTVTEPLLALLRVDSSRLPADQGRLKEVLDRSFEDLNDDRSHALVVDHGVVAAEPLSEPEPGVLPEARIHRAHRPLPGATVRRVEALQRLLEIIPDEAAVVSTTGKTSRELFTIADRPQNFYVVGAMGSAATVGLGVALHSPRPVVVVDGDGALLMRLGSLATVGAQAPDNLVHVVLDNGVHDSTGGQRSLSATTDLPAVAAACGYARVYECVDLGAFEAGLKESLYATGPSLIHLRITPGSLAKLGRPTVHPADVASRFRDFVRTASAAQAR